MSDIPEGILASARQMLATIAQKLTSAEIPAMASLDSRERDALRDAIFRSLDFAYQEGYGDGQEDASHPVDISGKPNPNIQ
jgi:hypothetical protein